MKLYLMILIILSISCRRRNKDEHLYESVQSGIFSGIVNGLVRNYDKVISPLKSSAEKIVGMYQVVTKGIDLRVDHIMLNNEFLINPANKIKVFKEVASSSCIKDTLNWFKDNPIAMNRLKLDQTGIQAAGKLVGNVGTKIIYTLPFISAFFNGYEAINRASDGDYFGATLKVANAALAFTPTPFFVSIIPSGINIIYDILK